MSYITPSPYAKGGAKLSAPSSLCLHGTCGGASSRDIWQINVNVKTVNGRVFEFAYYVECIERGVVNVE